MLSDFFTVKTSQKLYDEGVKLYRRGKTKEAIDKLSDAIKRETNKSDRTKSFFLICIASGAKFISRLA